LSATALGTSERGIQLRVTPQPHLAGQIG
jgi:hypothetical protein